MMSLFFNRSTSIPRGVKDSKHESVASCGTLRTCSTNTNLKKNISFSNNFENTYTHSDDVDSKSQRREGRKNGEYI